MPFSDSYRNQVELLVRSLPAVAAEACFALKGGTAINLFVRNLPRLSIDIDLTYLPISGRDESLKEIDRALRRIGDRVQASNPGMTVTGSAPGTQDTINKMVLRARERVQIKVEVTPVLRGCVYEPEIMSIAEKAEDEFGFAEVKVLSFADLYAGKILAALDRQHPRDLFDIHDLLNRNGITDELRTAFVVYLISHNRPPQTLLSPNLKDISHEYETNFVGMTEEDLSLDILCDARSELIEDVRLGITGEQKDFLLSFYSREPQWDLLGVEGVHELPAVRWRERNLDVAGKETCEDIVRKLEAVF